MTYSVEYQLKSWQRRLHVRLKRVSGGKLKVVCATCRDSRQLLDMGNIESWKECGWCHLVIHVACANHDQLRLRCWDCVLGDD
jgi:hypothetical protein